MELGFLRLLADLPGNISDNQVLCNNFIDTDVTVSEKAIYIKVANVRTEV